MSFTQRLVLGNGRPGTANGRNGGRDTSPNDRCRTTAIDFSDPGVASLLDLDSLYADLLAYKQACRARGYGNVLVQRSALVRVLELSELYVERGAMPDPETVQRYALDVLQSYHCR